MDQGEACDTDINILTKPQSCQIPWMDLTPAIWYHNVIKSTREHKAWPRQLITPILPGFAIWRVSMVIQITPAIIDQLFLAFLQWISWEFHQNLPAICWIIPGLLFVQSAWWSRLPQKSNHSYHFGRLHKISSRSVHNFLSSIASKQTNQSMLPKT